MLQIRLKRNSWSSYMHLAWTCMLALALSLVSFKGYWVILKANWVALLFLHWIMVLPKFNWVYFGFIVGLIQDLLYGSPLGLWALSMAILNYSAVLLQRRIILSMLWQQILVVALLVSLSQLTRLSHALIYGNAVNYIDFIREIISSALWWPVISKLLTTFTRQSISGVLR